MNIPHNRIHGFFSSARWVVIILPLVILAAGVLMKSTLSEKQEKKEAVIRSVTGTPTVFPKSKLNFTGPFVCEYRSPEGTTSAYIRNKKARVLIESPKIKDNYVYSGGCIYVWRSGNKEGVKVCGLDQFVSMAESLLSLGLSDANEFFDGLMGGRQAILPGVDFKKILSSCVSKAIPSMVEFEPPKGILFRDQTGTKETQLVVPK